jgi:hypothetical protein
LAGVVTVGAILAFNQPPTTVACFSGTPARGGALETRVAVDQRIKSMVFNVKMTDISGGSVRWFVEDPSGQTRWSGSEATPGTFTSGPMTGSGGEWTLNLVSEADTLSYRFEWVSVDPAATDTGSSCYFTPVLYTS